jgi:hypothetical protein
MGLALGVNYATAKLVSPQENPSFFELFSGLAC